MLRFSMAATMVLPSLFWTPAFAAAPSSLAEMCNNAYVQSVLPPNDLITGISPSSASVTTNAVTNYTAVAGNTNPGKSGLDFCNVTFSYSHAGLNDKVNLWFWLPAPPQYRGRFLATGGGGLAITSGQNALNQGLPYGAATGTTDGGFGSWRTDLQAVLLRANGTMNYEMLYSYAYTAIREMTVLGKEFTRRFYASAPEQKLYAYFQGCSEGGREGFSQVQRYGTLFDGVAVGAPAFRQAFLQVMHLFPLVAMQKRDYYPPPCEFEAVNNYTVRACDDLDGRKDGVIGRTDLCKLHYNGGESRNEPYDCPAGRTAAFPGVPASGPAQPAAKGRVSWQAAAIAQDIWNGMWDSDSRQVYVSVQPGASLSDATTTYNAATGQYEAVARGFGVQFVNQMLRQIDSSHFPMQNVTADTLRGWILEGMQKFSNTIQTTWPDLSEFKAHGGKILHFHGEADGAIPAASSTIYHDAVRRTMYPSRDFNASHDALAEWYRLFIVPGAGHCGPSREQPGPWPVNALESLIAWVEKGENPTRLNATVAAGPNKGETQRLCSFPLRPMWKGDAMECEYDQNSVDTWLPRLDSIPVPVY